MGHFKKYNYNQEFILKENGKAELPETAIARRQAFAEGKESGRKEMQDNLYHIVLNIQQVFREINEVQQNSYQYITNDILTCTQVIIQKLLPYLKEKYLTQEIAYFVQDSLSFLKQKGLLTITVHPDNIGALKEHLKDLPENITFTQDQSVDKADCHIKWDDGGIEKLTSGVTSKVEQALENLRQEFPGRLTAQHQKEETYDSQERT